LREKMTRVETLTTGKGTRNGTLATHVENYSCHTLVTNSKKTIEEREAGRKGEESTQNRCGTRKNLRKDVLLKKKISRREGILRLATEKDRKKEE